STGEPPSREKLRARRTSASAATPPIGRPTMLPMAELFNVLPGVVRLDERHPGGGPVQPGGRVLVMVLGCELATEWAINAPRPSPAAGRAKAPIMRPLPGSFRA